MAAPSVPPRVAIERELYQRSLRDFIRAAWPLIEPGLPLAWNWHLDAICDLLEAVTRGEVRDAGIEMPPRMLKSVTVSVMWPAWAWTHTSTLRWIFGSYALHLALRDAVKTRDIITHKWYQKRWPLELAGDQNVKGYYRNAQGGHRFAASVGGGVTGEGADIIVVDDPLKAQDAHSELARMEALRWWREVMPSRLNDLTTGRRVVVMQRLHEADLAGWCREQGYTMLSLPNEYNPNRSCLVPEIGWHDPRTEAGELLFPQRIGPDETAKLKSDLGSYAYAGQYNQEPAPDDGTAMFPPDAWPLWTHLPTDQDGRLRRPDDALVSWDMTFTGKDRSKRSRSEPDYVVGQLWYRYGADMYLIDEARGQWSFTETKARVVAFDERCRTVHPFPPTRHVVERKANGEAILSDLGSVVAGITGFNPDPYGDKTARAWHLQPRQEARQLHLPAGARWLDEWRHEFRVFPNGRNDDRVDAASQAVLATGRRGWKAV